MSTTHTPIPWYATGKHVQSAAINEDNYVCEAEGNSEEQANANAALIVRAVNSHDELLAALTDLLEFARNAVPEYQADNMAHYEAIARAAIAAAEGRTLATPPSSPP
jgi:hypothetical protein